MSLEDKMLEHEFRDGMRKSFKMDSGVVDELVKQLQGGARSNLFFLFMEDAIEGFNPLLVSKASYPMSSHGRMAFVFTHLNTPDHKFYKSMLEDSLKLESKTFNFKLIQHNTMGNPVFGIKLKNCKVTGIYPSMLDYNAKVEITSTDCNVSVDEVEFMTDDELNG